MCVVSECNKSGVTNEINGALQLFREERRMIASTLKRNFKGLKIIENR